MRKTTKYFSMLGCAAVLAGVVSSCASEAPFSTDGEAMVRFDLSVNRAVTRATPDNEEALRADAMIYISNDKGLLHKWHGAENIPQEVPMRFGSYVAEAWAGDSTSASFSDKFYRGFEPFTVNQNSAVTQVTINCRLANVVASVDPATVDESLMKDYNINIANTRGNLDFTADNIDTAKGYYMMPNGETSLTYTITGANAEGKAFTKTGTIPNVQPAHEYRLKFSYNPTTTDEGGAFITVEIDDSEVDVVEEILIKGGPVFAGFEFNLDNQVHPDQLTQKIIRVAAFDGLKEMWLESDQYAAMKMPNKQIDVLNATAEVVNALNANGIQWSEVDKVTDDLHKYFLTFTDEWIQGLPQSESEYVLNLTAVDNNNRSRSAQLRIANTEAAIVYADPVVIDPTQIENDNLAVRSTEATLSLDVVTDDAGEPKIQYREQGTSAWQEAAAATRTRAKKTVTFTLSGLKPSTTYEYRAVCGDFEGEIYNLTTESQFTIPNGNMEDWSNWSGNAKVLIPGANGERTFWDSGNHGSATMSKTLTQGVSAMGSNGLCAELKSQFVGIGGTIGKFAAGNLFVGEYKETVGTDGKISFGRPYDGSHPVALKFKANYRPGVAAGKGAGTYVPEGTTDQSQIYVALTTAPFEVFTKSGSEQRLFNPNDQSVLAYGQVTWDAAFGPDGALQEVTIPIEYYERARTQAATHLVIVCSASKFGDYFQGGEGSTMYLDDFELVY